MLGKRKIGEAQQQKKKKKWIEELDDDSEEIDLDCLNNLKDDEKDNLEKGEDDALSDELHEEDGGNEIPNIAAKDDDKDITQNGNNKKKKRYDWMSSEDEDISSEEEEEEVMEEDEKGQGSDQSVGGENVKCKSETSLLEPHNTTEQDKFFENYSKTKDRIENGNVGDESGNESNAENNYAKNENKHKSNVNEKNSIDDCGHIEIIDNINKYSINPLDIKLEEIEHLVTYVYFNNIHFNCVTEHLVEFLENFTKDKIMQINSDKSTNYTIIYKNDEKNNDKVLINKFPHYGKLFVHVKNYQDVLRLLKLNETQFMGRIIKSTQAYKKKNSFFILQAPVHYKYFIQVVASEKSKNSLNYVWIR
ncbi:hypothetical protein, conserved [Plasmodium gonderi]|uniref:Uncharacterized protein n=1 Tax=Plasmodium gonderi TaxID=77519 RepID=A0A1Y1JPA3_PLAGO|nr:hypothetical protein, conserved [Plasmodium gonderi]GAW83275.1 hypothetical protein, conserved [Plasmodium gonderi]